MPPARQTPMARHKDQAREIHRAHGNPAARTDGAHRQHGHESDLEVNGGWDQTNQARASNYTRYIAMMTDPKKGPMAIEIETRLIAALSPTSLAVINDSAKHHGHMGDDGSGESHFTVEIESAAFAGQNRVNRQRMVNKALGDLPGQRVHALAIKAKAPGE